MDSLYTVYFVRIDSVTELDSIGIGNYNLHKIYIDFLYPATLISGGGGYYVIPSIQKNAFELLSVCLYVRPSAHRFHSLLGEFFNQFSSNLV